MKRVVVAAICIILTSALPGLPVESSDESDLASLRASEACLAAGREPDFGDLIEISAPIADLVIEYKKGWSGLCSGKSEGTIYPLYQQAKVIEESFLPVFQKADGILNELKAKEGSDKSYEVAVEIHKLLQGIYPSFMPLFKGSYIEYNYFEASLGDFRKYAPLGDAGDKLFFREYFILRGEALLHPWYRSTWDYGGCLRFGEYDWVDALDRIDFLKKKLDKPLYIKTVLEFERKLKDTLESLGRKAEGGWPICTCQNRDAVPDDLRDILEKITAWPDYEETALMLRKVLDAIEKDKVDILSESEKHCSGG